MKELCITIPCEPAKPWTDKDVRPLYVRIGEDDWGGDLMAYECPFCAQQGPRRLPMEKHMGMDPGALVGCPVLKNNREREDFVRRNFGRIRKERESCSQKQLSWENQIR